MRNISDVGYYRLQRQGITSARFSTPGEVVAWLGAVQAQDYPGTLWAIGLRTLQATEADVEQAVIDKTIVRTWPMRGTLHFIAAQDIRWMLALMTPRILRGAVTRHAQLNLDEAIFARSRELLGQALAGGKVLTRTEMYEVLEQAGITTVGQRGIHIFWRLSQEGLLCFGPFVKKQPTFVLLNEWLPDTRNLQREEALAELAKRYFASHGPATVQDLMWWSGLPATDIRTGLEMVKSELAQVTINNQTYCFSPHIANSEKPEQTVHLLPGFDEFVLGYKDRSAVLSPEKATKIVPGNNGMFMPTIVSNNQIVGTWKRAVKKGKIIITPEFFEASGQTETEALEIAAERYGRFLGMPASLA